MVMDQEKEKQVLDVFKGISEYKEIAKGANASASDAMKNLAESFSADKNEVKQIKKILKEAMKQWLSKMKGEKDVIGEAIILVEKISPTKE